MAGPGCLQSLLGQQAQGFAHAEIHIDWRRMVVHPIAAPVLIQQGDVQVPVGDLAGPGHHFCFGSRAHGEGTKSWRTAEALLAAAVGQIYLPFIEVEGHRTKGSDGIKQEQAVVLTAEIADALHGLADPGRCFGMDNGQNFGPMGGYGVLEFSKAECFPPGLLDRHNIGPVATGHVGQT